MDRKMTLIIMPKIQEFISTAQKNSENILQKLYHVFNEYNFITNPFK